MAMLDPHSPGVFTLLEHMDTQIEKKRDALERVQNDYAQTQYLRGQIKALRQLKLFIIGDPETDESDA